MEVTSIKINNTDLPVKEYNGQRVVTFKEIDAVHERPEGAARKRFNDNKKHFINGVDFFKITASEFRTLFGGLDARYQMDITLITESGYLMLVKSFNDDLAWTVQRQLVNVYFRSTPEQRQEATEQTMSDLEMLAQGMLVAQKVMDQQREQIKALEQEAAEHAPLVSFAEDVGTANGSISIGDFAKILFEKGHREIGQKRLFKRLRDGKILDRRNMPYQKYMDAGLFEVIEVYNRYTGQTYRQPRLTGKGQRKIYEQLFSG